MVLGIVDHIYFFTIFYLDFFILFLFGLPFQFGIYIFSILTFLYLSFCFLFNSIVFFFYWFIFLYIISFCFFLLVYIPFPMNCSLILDFFQKFSIHLCFQEIFLQFSNHRSINEYVKIS